MGTPPWKLCVQVTGLFGYLVEISCGESPLGTPPLEAVQVIWLFGRNLT